MSYPSKLPHPMFPERRRSVFESCNVPFYIYAPDYRHSSGGIRVLHYFCHILNELGEEAYIVNARVVSPKLRTPQLTLERMKEHFKSGRQPITVYPEVVHSNPFNTPMIARWLLNRPGHLGKPVEFEAKDLILYYEPWCLPEDLTGQFVHIDPLDYSIFNNLNNPDDNQRTLECYYANKYFIQGTPILDEHKNLTSLGQEVRRTPEEIAAVLRKTKVLYCYEPSGIINEAQACGCPVLLVRSEYWKLPEDDSHHKLPGCAVYQEEDSFARAQASLALVKANHQKLLEESWSTTRDFVASTYTALDDLIANGKPCINELQRLWSLPMAERQTVVEEFEQYYLKSGLYFKDTGNTTHSPGNDTGLYKTFRSRVSLQEIDGQLLAERMLKTWQHKPKFNVLIETRAGEEALLADTIDSIATQWYSEWHLSVLTTTPPPDPSLTTHPQVSWIIRGEDEAIRASMDWVIQETPGDWLFIIEPGHKIDPHALAYFADTLNLNSDAQLIYCDEDVELSNGSLVAPRFKPDFNLELLRGMYYFGPAIAVRKAGLLQCGGWSEWPDAALYDISLRILDCFGPQAIVHQKDPLLHTAEKTCRLLDNEGEQAALQAHLARQALDVTVTQGLLQGTQKTIYALGSKPKISIIIPSRDQPGYLSHCIDSIVDNTTYPNWELVIVDHETSDPDALKLIESLSTHPALQERSISIRQNGLFNYAALCNAGARIASGDVLLFLDNDTEIIQADWLEILLGYLQQPQVAAVAPRLSKPDSNLAKLQDGPRILGLSGMAGGMAGAQTNLLEPGYCGRLQVAQDTSALNGSCFAINAAIFNRLGGMNETDTPVYEAVLELCLRIGQAGLRMIWTPWVDVVHHGGATRNRLEADTLQRARLTDILLKEHDHLFSHHLHALANDPNYHRHLSLQNAFNVEPTAVIDWDTRFHDRLRILGQPLSGGSGEYRMLSPFRALQKAGLAQTCQVHLLGAKTQRVLNPIELARAEPDVLMLQQAIDDIQINQLRRYRKYLPDIYIAYSVDDVLGNLPRKHYLYNFQAREGKSRMREGLSMCNRLIASTEPIADYCRDMIKDIVVVPNRLDGNHWLHQRSRRGQGKRPRVGWAGAQQHLGDLEMIQEVVEALHKEVEWVFMGMCPAALKPFVSEEHPFVPWAAYPEKLASLDLDLAIAPLEQHFFNEGKSNLRLLEYGAMAWPVVCTNIFPFQTNNAPVKRVDNTVRAWTEAIRERIYDLDAAYKEGDQLRDWVLKHYIIEDHIDDWLHALTPSISSSPS